VRIAAPIPKILLAVVGVVLTAAAILLLTRPYGHELRPTANGHQSPVGRPGQCGPPIANLVAENGYTSHPDGTISLSWGTYLPDFACERTARQRAALAGVGLVGMLALTITQWPLRLPSPRAAGGRIALTALLAGLAVAALAGRAALSSSTGVRANQPPGVGRYGSALSPVDDPGCHGPRDEWTAAWEPALLGATAVFVLAAAMLGLGSVRRRSDNLTLPATHFGELSAH
jgi:hypothetical protein